MKFLVLVIIVLSLYLIYRLSFPRQAGKTKRDETPPPPLDGYEAVVKSRFILPDRSNLATSPAQHDDRTKNSEKQDKKPDIFAAGNENPPVAVIKPDEFDEVFSEVNPEDLDIERDENEADENDEPDFDAEEEAEEIRESAGVTEGYAGGFSFDELAEVIREADHQPDAMTKAAVEMLRDFSKTDMFEQLVSSDAGRAARIAAILDRKEQSLAGQDKDAADDSNGKYRDFDIEQYLS